MLRKILALISLVGLITIALVMYSLNSSVPDVEGTVSGYRKEFKQQLVEKTKEVAGPTLAKFGIDVEKTKPDDLNIVKQKLEEASHAVDEASKQIGAPR